MTITATRAETEADRHARVTGNILRNIALTEAEEIECSECGRRLDWTIWNEMAHAGSTCEGGPDTQWVEYSLVSAVIADDTDAAWRHARVLAIIEGGATMDIDDVETTAAAHIEWATTEAAGSAA